MKLQYTPEDAARGKPIPPEAAELLAELRPHLNGAGDANLRLTFFGLKFSKLLAEFEVHAAGGAPLACFAKSCDPQVAARTFDTLTQLVNAGLCPPSRFTVTRPLAHLKERHIVVVEKAPGVQFTQILFENAGDATEAATAAARWLATLHGTNIRDARRFDMTPQLHRFGSELAAALPPHAERIRAIERQALASLSQNEQPAVPSHRDFHPDNVFLAPDGRVTLIDLDQFGMQEPAGDVAYCLAQMAIMSALRTGSFRATAAARDHFLDAYTRNAAPVHAGRLAWHFAFAFIKSLHYELCVFHTGNAKIIEPWLAAAELTLRANAITLPEMPNEAQQSAPTRKTRAAR